jgi:hypothetical protein
MAVLGGAIALAISMLARSSRWITRALLTLVLAIPCSAAVAYAMGAHALGAVLAVAIVICGSFALAVALAPQRIAGSPEP